MKIAHVVSHSHWDREWYLPFERHHLLLVELMDKLLDTFAQDPDFRSFHLDGQTIVLDDYLAVRPGRRDEVRRLVESGRLVVGPWYILQDEWLTSSEANLRNLQFGMAAAEAWGRVCRIGYFPDSFGNMGQAPQILKQASLDAALFGRGVKPTGFNNEVGDGDFESRYSELWWEAPDGSRVLGVLFANWYSNGIEVPTSSEALVPYWTKRLHDAQRYASTNHLLFLNGCDHQPVQTDLSEALANSGRLFPDVKFVHASFPEYLEALRPDLPADLAVVRGELRSQRTDGWYTLANTASSRIRLKQANARCQTLFESVAEPLATLAFLSGAAYPHEPLAYGWKLLMQNHPHDSICGCSVDPVHREMAVRFEKAEAVARHMIDESLAYLARQTGASAWGPGARAFVVVNTSGHPRTGLAEVEVDLFRQDFGSDYQAAMAAARAFVPSCYQVVDETGRPLPAEIVVQEVSFGYDLPKDRFRVPFAARKARITVAVQDLPPLSSRTYALVPLVLPAPPSPPSLLTDPWTLENAHLKATLEDDGTLTLVHKATGRVYRDLCRLDDTGDTGNEYIFHQAAGSVPLVTGGRPAQARWTVGGTVKASLVAEVTLEVPVSADETLAQEVANLVEFRQRKAGRSTETVPLSFRITYSLGLDDRALTVEVSFDNRARDHRVRVLIPTDVVTDVHEAESVFEVAQRPNAPAPEWENPCRSGHQQAFVGVHDARGGLTVANQGLPEYEVLDERTTIALTLVRSVGELGDWGVFPTPEAQEQGAHTARFALVPHGPDDDRFASWTEARLWTIPWSVAPVTGPSNPASTTAGRAKPVGQRPWVPRAEAGLLFSSFKVSAQTGLPVYRWFNATGQPRHLTWQGPWNLETSTVLEGRGTPVEGQSLSLAPFTIATVTQDAP